MRRGGLLGHRRVLFNQVSFYWATLKYICFLASRVSDFSHHNNIFLEYIEVIGKILCEREEGGGVDKKK